MRIFITGATGFIGTAIVQDLLAHGHQVVGLARSDASAAALTAAGAGVLRGALEDPDSLKRGAAEADGVIHAAFNHDFTDYLHNTQADGRAIETLGAALEGSDRPLLVTSGMLVTPGRVVTEDDAMGEEAAKFPRVSEPNAMALAARGVRASVVRLPPSVHGRDDHGFVPHLIRLAREKGFAAFVGDGENRWPAVHRHDTAPVYRLALEQRAAGAKYHAVGETGIPFRRITEAIGRGLKLPVKSLTPQDAQDYFTWFAMFAAMDVPGSGEKTQKLLGVTPTQPELLDDMAAHYF